MAEKYNLNWPIFSEHLQLLLKEIYQEGKYSDVTLVSDDQTQFKAHKIVLSACSPFFKNIIDSHPTEHPVFKLKGVNSFELESILQLTYLGEGKLHQERMGEFINVAKKLEVNWIAGINMDIDNVGQLGCETSTLTDRKKEENPTQNEMAETFQEEKQCDRKISIEKPSITLICSDTKPFKCSSCEAVFSLKKSMLKHIKSEHKGIKYPCTECDYQATQKSALRSHIQSKHDLIKYPCTKCNYQGTTQATLKAHIQTKHEGIRYPCTECDYQATQQSALRRHIQSKHDLIKYPCTKCNYQGTTQATLKAHIQSKHEGIRYPCNQCDYKGTQRSHLQTHIKSKHQGITYPCDYCDYQATSRDALKFHLRAIHMKCNLCSFQTKRMIELYRHEKTHQSRNVLVQSISARNQGH